MSDHSVFFKASIASIAIAFCLPSVTHADQLPSCSLRCKSASVQTSVSPRIILGEDYYKKYQNIIWGLQSRLEYPGYSYNMRTGSLRRLDQNLGYAEDTASLVGKLGKASPHLALAGWMLPKARRTIGIKLAETEKEERQKIREWLHKALEKKSESQISDFEQLYQMDARLAADTLLRPALVLSDQELINELLATAIKEMAAQIEAVKNHVASSEEALESVIDSFKKAAEKKVKLAKVASNLGEMSSATDLELPARKSNDETGNAEQIEKIKQKAISIGEFGQTFSNQMSSAATILNNVGEPDLADAFSKVSEVANVVSNVAAAFVNPMAILPAFASLSGLFGSPGPDPVILQMKQQFDKVNARLDEIEELIRENHRETMSALREVKRGLIDVLSGVEQNITLNIDTCATLLSDYDPAILSPNSVGRLENFENIYPSSDAEIRRRFGVYGNALPKCLDGITEIFPDQPQFNRIFILRRIFENADAAKESVDQKEQIIAFLNEWQGLVTGFVQDNLTDSAKRTLSRPLKFPNDLGAKIYAARSLRVTSDQVNPSAITEILNVRNVLKYANYVVALHNWFEWQSSSVVTGREQVEGIPASQIGLHALKRALEITNAAIAQQALLEGDLIVPVMWHDMTDWKLATEVDREFLDAVLLPESPSKKNPSSQRSKIVSLLASNPLLARNFVLFHTIHSGARAKALAYHMALQSTGKTDFLQYILGDSFAVERVENPPQGYKAGWFYNIDGIVIPLPTLEEVLDARSTSTDEMDELLTLRERLRFEILTYDSSGISSVALQDTMAVIKAGLFSR